MWLPTMKVNRSSLSRHLSTVLLHPLQRGTPLRHVGMTAQKNRLTLNHTLSICRMYLRIPTPTRLQTAFGSSHIPISVPGAPWLVTPNVVSASTVDICVLVQFATHAVMKRHLHKCVFTMERWISLSKQSEIHLHKCVFTMERWISLCLLSFSCK